MSDGITGNQLESGVVMVSSHTVLLTNAQIKALPTGNGLEMVAAPGVGKIISFVLGLVSLDTTGGMYEGFSENSEVFFGLSEAVKSSLPLSESFGNQVTSMFEFEQTVFATFPPFIEFDIGGILLLRADHSLSNTPLKFYLTNESNLALTGGHASNQMKVTALYSIMDL